jgi:protein-disulfide isomerase
MSRLSLVLVALVGVLAGGLGVSLLRPQPVTLSDSDVRAIISDMLMADRASSRQVAELDPAKVNKIVEDYLMSDPQILERVGQKLQEARQVAAREVQKALLDDYKAAIYDATANVVLGNPEGDVTLVELFDYNCGYCRNALPDLAALLAEDPKLKVILKDFPILTQGSIDAARVAALVHADSKINYWDFHQKLFSVRGEVGADQALRVAEELGGNRVEMMLDMNGKQTTEALQDTYRLAKALDISGTPTYILGDELIPGAIGLDVLRTKITNLRACGSTDCSTSIAAAAS